MGEKPEGRAVARGRGTCGLVPCVGFISETGRQLDGPQVVGPQSILCAGRGTYSRQTQFCALEKLDSMFNDHRGELANGDNFFGRRLGWTELALCR